MAPPKTENPKPKIRLPYGQWLTRRDVRKLSVSNNKIGGWGGGEVYAGRITFSDGRRHRAAFKLFQQPLTFADVRRHEAAVRRLAEVGARIPKTGFVKHEGKWVQVMQLFRHKGKGRLKELRSGPAAWSIYNRHLNSLSVVQRTTFLEDMGRQYAKVVRAGFFPDEDLIHHYFSHEDKTGVLKSVIIDLDVLAETAYFFLPNSEHMRIYGYKNTLQGRILASFAELVRALPEEHHEHAVRAFFEELPYKRAKAQVLKFLQGRIISPQAKRAIEGLDRR